MHEKYEYFDFNNIENNYTFTVMSILIVSKRINRYVGRFCWFLTQILQYSSLKLNYVLMIVKRIM